MSTITQLDRFEIDYMLGIVVACLDTIAAHDAAHGRTREVNLGEVASMCASAVSEAKVSPKGVQKATELAWRYLIGMVTSETTRAAFRKVNRITIDDPGLITRVDVGGGQLREVKVRVEG